MRGQDHIENNAIHELERVYRQVFRRMNQEFNKKVDQGQGISGPQSIILDLLECRGRQKVSQLAESLGITPGAVTGLCDKLIAGEYAVRKRTDEDRRVVYLEITIRGVAVLDEIKKLRSKISNMFYQGLSDVDIQHLIRIYNQMLANINNQKE